MKRSSITLFSHFSFLRLLATIPSYVSCFAFFGSFRHLKTKNHKKTDKINEKSQKTEERTNKEEKRDEEREREICRATLLHAVYTGGKAEDAHSRSGAFPTLVFWLQPRCTVTYCMQAVTHPSRTQDLCA
ncbi:hypothetical protein BO82DRAFT_20506 [Aspergillus uvarum CBS 121591]|uniref:Uncharacterized protein n=1 Tax=Aspergillus uvarum CBS 121591 TaxID=1448315 RepID=A0A319BQ50_9EURO|nr:hypothetical protein BO82DRAFT_20506 [Aspergillus uvarum CBS 121591]PYH75566.1 hypothetical protein BO82DRAFT_20506 [Aspergillus uvarum CBS 121591]